MSTIAMFILLAMAVQCMASVIEQPSESVVLIRASSAFAEIAFHRCAPEHFVLKMKPHLMEYYLSDVLSDIGKNI